ncbi:MAG TPA: AraC family transcriptional regulator, partial [Thalassospira sp.]|nr:AraC family transcriptional regulator [Thalassospira sp.]
MDGSRDIPKYPQHSRPRPDHLPRPVYVRMSDLPAGYSIGAHSHDWHQLIFAIEGTMTVTTKAGIWVVPPQRAVWVPPGVEHAVSHATFTRARHIYIDKNAPVDLPDRCTVLDVSPLLRELIRAATEIPIEYD